MSTGLNVIIPFVKQNYLNDTPLGAPIPVIHSYHQLKGITKTNIRRA